MSSWSRHVGRRAGALALAVGVALLSMLAFAGVALAAEEEAAPKLDYTFEWWSFILCVVLVIGFYIMIFTISEKEFKKVINERFGPKR